MKRDELKELLTSIWHQPIATGDGAKLLEVIAWLERLPSGCELAGWRGYGCGSGLGSGLGVEHTIYDDDVKRGTSYIVRAVCMNPADEVTDET